MSAESSTQAPTPIWFDTPEELDRAVADIAALSPATRKVLASAIEHQGRTVTKISPSAQQLEDLGFLFIQSQNRYDGSAVLSPSLWGEEALDTYETRHMQGRTMKNRFVKTKKPNLTEEVIR